MHISHNTHFMPTPAAPAVVVFGCGNPLLGDDGFGPAVIAQLARAALPATVRLIDAGTAIREFLLDYLLEPALRPALVIIVDAEPGEDENSIGQVRRRLPAELPARKIHDFSLHQFPTINLLRELSATTGIEVVLLLAGIAPPAALCAEGLSPPLRAAVDAACALIHDLVAPFAALEVCAP